MGSNDDKIRQIANEALAGLPADDPQALLRRLAFGDAGSVNQLFARPEPPVRRRPRRAEPVTLRVRVDLEGTKPPLWRRLELASDLFLDDVHQIIQAAFGWTDSHLHGFASGPTYYGQETEHYLCPFSADDGDEGIPEEDVRLDEVLVDVRDKLFYLYDFGDGWHHVIRLEAVLARDESAPAAICTAGRRPGPAEDCGGVGGYELLVAATDPKHPDHVAARAEYADCFGPEIDPQGWAPTPFDLDEINDELAGMGEVAVSYDISGPLATVLDAMRSLEGKHTLGELVRRARLSEPVLVDAAAATGTVRRYAWLLDRVGDDGITLTKAGYLPPVHVEAAFTELGFDEDWIGAGNREEMTIPVLELRESAQRLGLLRKYRGRLLATPRGRALRSDPVELWWYLAERIPAASRDGYVHQAGLLYLLGVAAGITEGLDALVADLLDALGWTSRDGSPVSRAAAAEAASEVRDALHLMGLLVRDRSVPGRPERPSVGALDFARAALTAGVSSAPAAHT